MRALNLVTAIDSSGYGVVGLNLLHALSNRGIEVALFPYYGRSPGIPPSLQDVVIVKRALARQATYPRSAPCLRIASEFDMALFVGRGPRVGLSFFETDRFSDKDRHHLEALDHLVVASAWARLVTEANGIRVPRISVVPMGVDREVFHEGERPEPGDTRFLHVGKWEHRKGQDFLLEAFARAFEPGDAVVLELMCDNPLIGERNAEWKEHCRRSPMRDRIRFLPRVAAAVEVAERMRSADCGVFPTRAEGWNLELLEMMSCGKPVIATDYSGHTEFADADNALLIEIDELEDAIDVRYHRIYGRDKIGRWARLGERQMAQAVNHMRTVHAAKQEGHPLQNAAGIATARRRSWERSAEELLAALEG